MLVSRLYGIFFVVLFFYVDEVHAGIHNQSCGSIFLSISALSRKILMNWHYRCNRLPDYLLMREKKSDNQHEILEQIEVKTRYGSYETRTVWKDEFPTNWHDPHPKHANYYVCTKYYIVSFQQNIKENWDCLRVHPKWMATFPLMRLRNMFIPGTHSSGGFGRIQHYDFYKQLLFGIRYMDVKVGIDKTRGSDIRFYVNDKSFSLPKELRNVKRFLDRSKNEVVILDFRGFFSFGSTDDHELLIEYLLYFFHYQLAPSILSQMHPDGPSLRYLQYFNYRVIVNYRHPELSKKYAFLWDAVFIKDCKAQNITQYKQCLHKTAQDHTHKERLCAIYANQKRTNSLLLGHDVNVNLSRWIISKGLQRHINILAIDYFETSNIIADAIEANSKKPVENVLW